MLNWYSMTVMIPVPVAIYALVLLAFMVSQYFTLKILRSEIMATRRARAELLEQIHKGAASSEHYECNKPKEPSHA